MPTTGENYQELRITCPECDNTSLKGRHDPQCYVNLEKEVWLCHRCHAKGRTEALNLDELEVIEHKTTPKVLDPIVFRQLLPLNEEALIYIRKRGLEAQADQFKYDAAKNAIAIACRDKEGTLTGIKYRFINPLGSQPKYIAEPGSKSGSFWLRSKNSEENKIIVVEGEFDAYSAREATDDADIVALQSSNVPASLLMELNNYEHIYIAVDDDEAGEGALQKLLEASQGRDLKRLRAPGHKDLNSFLSEDPRAFKAWLCKELKTPLELISKKFEEIWPKTQKFLSDKVNIRGISTGFTELDNLLGGGLRPFEFIIFHAEPKAGKSTFCNNLSLNLAMAGTKVGIVSFELPPHIYLGPALASMITGENSYKAQGRLDINQIQMNILNNLVFFDSYGHTPWPKVKDWILFCSKKLGIKHFVIDHNEFIFKDASKIQETQALGQDIRALCNVHGLTLIVVAQTKGFQRSENSHLGMDTVYGGKTWAKSCTAFMTWEQHEDEQDVRELRLIYATHPKSKFNPHAPLLYYYNRDSYLLEE